MGEGSFFINYEQTSESTKRNPLVPFEPPRILEGWHLFEPSWIPQARRLYFRINSVVHERHPLVPFEPPRILEGWHLFEPSWISQARQLCFLKLMLSCVKDTPWFLLNLLEYLKGGISLSLLGYHKHDNYVF